MAKPTGTAAFGPKIPSVGRPSVATLAPAPRPSDGQADGQTAGNHTSPEPVGMNNAVALGKQTASGEPRQ
jgi:hypothetical protein